MVSEVSFLKQKWSPFPLCIESLCKMLYAPEITSKILSRLFQTCFRNFLEEKLQDFLERILQRLCSELFSDTPRKKYSEFALSNHSGICPEIPPVITISQLNAAHVFQLHRMRQRIQDWLAE